MDGFQFLVYNSVYMTQIKETKVAVDIVIFTIKDNALKVILIQMKKQPFTGMWAFPGGLIDPKESLDEAARRELTEKAVVSDIYLEQLYTFGETERDPYGRVISVAYFALIDSKNVELETTAKYSDIAWFDVKKLPKLAYDHDNVANYALQRLRWKLEYTNVVYGLLPKHFTISELRSAYETILDRRLDRRNFQRKILSLNLLKKTKRHKVGKHRPAILYEFRFRKPTIIDVI